jgi:hypothetical protein
MQSAARSPQSFSGAFMRLTMFLPLAIAMPAAAQLPTDSIAGVFGRPGTTTGAVYRTTFPRADMVVKVGTVRVRPALALTTWSTIAPRLRDTLMMGDLVLKESEVAGAERALLREGFQIVAVHNHLLGETPRVVYLHYMGMGNPMELARKFSRVLAMTSTLKAASASVPGKASRKAPVSRIAAAPSPEPTASDVSSVSDILGDKVTAANGVMTLSVTTSGSNVQLDGEPVPPSLGAATAIALQPLGGGRVAATGDFVLLGTKVAAVQQALVDAGITVTALHNHMLTEQPRVFFMHFWAVGPMTQIATGLRKAIDAGK